MKMGKNVTISVIVPVYNVERFLPPCIDSILGQSVSELQIILVDDGSTDASGWICDEYAKKDKRIVVLHQQNAGVSAARNAGLEIATGRYITFADSDDVLPLDAYHTMLNAIKESDLVIGRMQRMNEDGNLENQSRFFREQIIQKRSYLSDLFEEKQYSYLGFLWDKLFCRAIIEENNIRFREEIKLNEDRLFLLEYILQCNSIYTTNRIIYYYRQRNSGVIKETRRNATVTDSELTVIDSFKAMQKICASVSDELYFICCRKSFESALDLLNRVSKQDKEKVKKIKWFLRENAGICLKNSQYGRIEKIKIIAHTLIER